VVTGKARTAIRHQLKHLEHEDAVQLGHRMLDRALENLDTSLDRLPPAASHTAFRFSNARRACAAISPTPTSSPLAGSSGIWPLKKTVLPARVACE
jgi:(p)ppGpp synthase/HD superfamily hydrolase